MRLSFANLCVLSVFALSFLSLTPVSSKSSSVGVDATVPIVPAPHFDSALFDGAAAPQSVESKKFGAEVSRLLNMFGNSVYTNRKAVVRELLSNAIDAIEKQHELQLSQKAADDSKTQELSSLDQYQVTIELDTEHNILSITDNGVGMTGEQLEAYLGTIAKSGSAEHVDKKIKSGENAANIIGQFGIGFYSFLLISDKAVVISKHDDDPVQHIWEADATANYRMYADPAGNTLGRGTRIMLKIRPDAIEEFMDHDTIEGMVKEFFSHDAHRIFLVRPRTITEEIADEAQSSAVNDEDSSDVAVEDEEGESKSKKTVEKTIHEKVLLSRSAKPIWKRKPDTVDDAEYDALYQSLVSSKKSTGGLAGDSEKYLAKVHFSGETARGESFGAVLYIPERPAFSPFQSQAASSADARYDVMLHVRGVFVSAKMDDDFIPRNLAFVRGVVDSDELSLNISRDILQNTRQLRSIRKKIVNKIISMMTEMAEASDAALAEASDKEGEAEEEEDVAVKKYREFYDAYSGYIKLEIAEHEEFRALLAPLLRFSSTKSEGKTRRSLDQYVADMDEKQKERKAIYYLAGKAKEIERSPFLARFRDRNLEVLLATDPIDEHLLMRMQSYEGFEFVNVAKEGVKIDDDEEAANAEFEEQYKDAKAWISKVLKARIARVVFVSGPVSVPGTMKSGQFGWTGNMERLISAQTSGNDDPMVAFMSQQKKTLELNPRNDLVREILQRASDAEKAADPELKVIVRVLADALMVSSGYAVKDPSRLSAGVERMAKRLLGVSVSSLGDSKDKKENNSEKDDVDNVYAPVDLNEDEVDDGFDMSHMGGATEDDLFKHMDNEDADFGNEEEEEHEIVVEKAIGHDEGDVVADDAAEEKSEL